MTLQQLIEESMSEYETRSYSGRGMYGRSCLGVIVNDALNFIFVLGYTIAEYNLDELTEDTIKAPVKIATDGMGLDTIVYFPGVPFVESEK